MATKVGGALLVAAGLAATTGCATLQKSASKDPMKCERDPSCKGHQDKSADCVTQCVDNPSCIDRCMSISGQQR